MIEDLEATLRAHPDDLALRSVYADALIASGDPWGEVIALALAGKLAAVKRKHRTIVKDLVGSLPSRSFTWSKGFICSATLSGPTSRLPSMLAELFALRAAAVIGFVELPTCDRAIAATLSRAAPPSLRSLFVRTSDGIASLAMPQLEALSLRVTGPLVLADLPTAIPNVRHLFLEGSGGRSRRKSISAAFVDELLDSPLLAQLEYLALCGGALDAAGAARLLARRTALAKLRGIYIENPPDTQRVAIERMVGAKRRDAYWKHHEAGQQDEVY